jgi:hypothetical protein
VLSVLFHTGLYFVVGFTAFLIDKVVGQPHLTFAESGVTWFPLAVDAALFAGAFLAVPMGITMFLNTLGKTKGDTSYHPQLKNLRGLWRSAPSRRTLIAGSLLIPTYWAYTAIGFACHRSFSAGIIGPDRIALTILFSWAILWLADVLRRPTRQTLPSCNVFMVLTIILLLSVGIGFVRE